MDFRVIIILSIFSLTSSEKHLVVDDNLLANPNISNGATPTPSTAAKKIDIGSLFNFTLPDFGSLFTKPTTATTTSSTTVSSSNTTTVSTTATPFVCECGKRRNVNFSRSFESESSSVNDDLVKIVNGTVSKRSEWPWTVAIVNITNSPNYVICGGSIISRDYIVTAGHCMSGLTTSQLQQLRIYLGTNKINGNGTTPLIIPIGTYQVHPKFATITGTEVNNYDIAIIRLATPIPQFNRSISPICLSQTGKPFVGKTVITTGWGDEYFNQSTGSNVLRQVPLSVIGNNDCNQTYGIITPEMICAVGRNPFKGTCQGDSGTGLYYLKPASKTYTLIGVTSFGANCQRGGPPVFTRVSSVINFIKEYTMNRTTYCTNSFFP